MRLINTSTLELKEFSEPKPPYAILSHCWYSPDEEEPTLKEYRKGLKNHTKGYKKIKDFCMLAHYKGFDWAWVDTCCIDKRSSAELSNSINSMYSWYKSADICYAFLSDVASVDWRSSKWWNRGWTLQELIAPPNVVFFDQDWKEISNRKSMAYGIEKLTRIPAAVLKGDEKPLRWTVAQRMAWAANRSTKFIEDRAYSLLGLFKISMPMLYGEGINAFQRLQTEILRKYPDESIFSWQQTGSSSTSFLARGPEDFEGLHNMQPIEEWFDDQDPDPRRENPPRVTSWGIELRANARRLEPYNDVVVEGQYQKFLWAITLTVASRDRIQELPCTIVLVRCGPAPYSYQRYECYHAGSAEVFCELRRRYNVGKIKKDKLFYLWFDEDIVSRRL